MLLHNVHQLLKLDFFFFLLLFPLLSESSFTAAFADIKRLQTFIRHGTAWREARRSRMSAQSMTLTSAEKNEMGGKKK